MQGVATKAAEFGNRITVPGVGFSPAVGQEDAEALPGAAPHEIGSIRVQNLGDDPATVLNWLRKVACFEHKTKDAQDTPDVFVVDMAGHPQAYSPNLVKALVAASHKNLRYLAFLTR